MILSDRPSRTWRHLSVSPLEIDLRLRSFAFAATSSASSPAYQVFPAQSRARERPPELSPPLWLPVGFDPFPDPHGRRVLVGGSSPMKPEHPLIRKLLELVRVRMVRPELNRGPCWEFRGVLDPGLRPLHAYGCVEGSPARARAPRAEKISLLVVDHLCRNRACCNPEHLEAVTSARTRCAAVAGREARVRRITARVTSSPARTSTDTQSAGPASAAPASRRGGA